MTTIKGIIFDLGGVLIDFSGMSDIRSLMAEDPGPDAIRPRWITCPVISAFERGEISSDQFASDFVCEWGLRVQPDDFVDIFKSWVKGTLAGTEDLLANLRPDYTLACLSNTNPIHWSQMMHDVGLYDQLDQHFASFQMGQMKPTRNVFSNVVAEMGYAPEQVLFFDDGVENVEGAKGAGLHAYQVQSPGEISMRLKSLGLTPQTSFTIN